MKRNWLFALVICGMAALIGISVWATSGEISTPHTAQGEAVRVFQADWTSDSSGNASGSFTTNGTDAAQVNGTLLQVAFKPSATAPTNLYDATITFNQTGVYTSTVGADLSATLSFAETPVTPSGFPYICNGTISFSVANAGNAKQGTIFLYVR